MINRGRISVSCRFSLAPGFSPVSCAETPLVAASAAYRELSIEKTVKTVLAYPALTTRPKPGANENVSARARNWDTPIVGRLIVDVLSRLMIMRVRLEHYLVVLDVRRSMFDVRCFRVHL